MNKNIKNRLGKGGECICPKCKTLIKHKRGIPCHETKCPKCGAKMLRKGSEHYYQWLDKSTNTKYKENNNE